MTWSNWERWDMPTLPAKLPMEFWGARLKRHQLARGAPPGTFPRRPWASMRLGIHADMRCVAETTPMR